MFGNVCNIIRLSSCDVCVHVLMVLAEACDFAYYLVWFVDCSCIVVERHLPNMVCIISKLVGLIT